MKAAGMVTARSSAWVPHAVLVTGLVLVLFPVYVAFVGSTLTASDILDAPMSLIPGPHLFENFARALGSGTVKTSGEPVAAMLLNSLVMALVIAAGKILISLPSAYAVVFFRFPLRRLCFWAIFVTLMLPVEVRIIPTYKIAADLSLIDSYGGLTLPLVASATATLLFRQFFLTIPDELVEAAKIDGAGPWRFLVDTVIPLSRTNIAALFVILFIYGWNQYLWPLLVTNSPSMTTIVIGIRQMIGNGDAQTAWHLVMAERYMRLTAEQQDEVAAQRGDMRQTRRATAPALEEILYEPLPVLDHGFVRVVDYMGDDAAIVQAARVSYGRGTRRVTEDQGLINYLMRHRHTTPFEMCEIKYHVKLPIFVARQWIRHRMANVNEYSARYSILDKEFYVPDPEQLAVQATTNRQSRGAALA